ncbi:MAG: phytoene/squalene synthase family protein [Planctomycetota bacterium]
MSVPSPEVEASYAYCRRVARRAAGNFYRGMRLTPEPKRSALFAVYAWMRAADDTVDNPPESGPETVPGAACRLDAFAEATDRAIDPAAALPDGELWPAVRDTVTRYAIPREYLGEMLAGQRGDLGGVAMKDFGELYTYCYRVASVVGLTCVKVWGDDGDPSVAKLAEYRGVALQLTNVLRDVAEDARRGRVYLPADELTRFGLPPEALRGDADEQAFVRLMRFQLERARSYYEMSATLERHLMPDCRATSWAIMRTYRVLLERIAERPARVLGGRVSLPLTRKLAVVAGAVAKRNF